MEQIKGKINANPVYSRGSILDDVRFSLYKLMDILKSFLSSYRQLAESVSLSLPMQQNNVPITTMCKIQQNGTETFMFPFFTRSSSTNENPKNIFSTYTILTSLDLSIIYLNQKHGVHLIELPLTAATMTSLLKLKTTDDIKCSKLFCFAVPVYQVWKQCLHFKAFSSSADFNCKGKKIELHDLVSLKKVH